LFNLGVLNGPDLDIIRGAIPDLTGVDAFVSDKKNAKAALGVIHDYISRMRNQIPPEIMQRARPNGDPRGRIPHVVGSDGVPELLRRPETAPAPQSLQDHINSLFADDATGPAAQPVQPAQPPAGATVAVNPQTGQRIWHNPKTNQWEPVQ
jgi:hypothetical protein